MSKLKKVLLMCTAYVLVAALAIGGTIAYLQDSDSDVNVMTLGNVSIAQHEYERATNTDGSYETKEIDGVTSYVLKDFTQGKPLLPATEHDANGNPYNYGAGDYGPTRVKMSQVDSHGSMDVFVNENAIDKFVTVENTGKTDAYVRTIIAMEIGSLTEARFDEVIKTSSFMTAQGVWKVTDIGIVEIGGNNYYIIEYVYNGAKALGGVHENGVLPAGDTTYPSLAQVYMTGSATNEDVEALDGNNNGKYDILVFSQAVQAAGFADAKTALDTAFGETTTVNHPWTVPDMIKSAEELKEAISIPNSVIKLGNDITTDTTIPENITAAIDLQNKKLEGVLENQGVADISNGTIDGDYVQNEGEATFTDVTMNAGTPSDYSNIARGEDAVTVYNNADIVSGGGGIAAAGGAKVVFNSGSVAVNSASTSGRYVFYTADAGSEIVINGGEFFFSKTLNQKRAYVYANADTTVIINGGTFGPASTRSGYTAGILGNGTVVIKGGTFGFNPSNWVADGYEAVQNGNTWTVVAK